MVKYKITKTAFKKDFKNVVLALLKSRQVDANVFPLKDGIDPKWIAEKYGIDENLVVEIFEELKAQGIVVEANKSKDILIKEIK
ncbi:MAG: hypothetical protein DRM99_04300 [Thermoplasmata archaeon]|nr:MAG: hypothetical protein DRM99_04300 [Thermoplasmata archaeon]